jgi:hypothetical protein
MKNAIPNPSRTTPQTNGHIELPDPRFDQGGGNRAQNKQRAGHPAVKGPIAAEVDYARGGKGRQDQRVAERFNRRRG